MKPANVPVIVALAMGLALGAPALAEDDTAPGADAPELTLDGVKRMVAGGVDDDVIVAKIEASDAVWNLTVDEILQLKREGLSSRVLAAVVRTGVIERHYGSRASGAGDASEGDDPRHAISRETAVVERYAPDVYTYSPYWGYRPRVNIRYGYSWGSPWAPTYGSWCKPYGYGHGYGTPWAWGHGHGHGGHGYGGYGHGGYGHGSHGGHGTHHVQGSGHGGTHATNHHGGHKPVIGTRGGRR